MAGQRRRPAEWEAGDPKEGARSRAAKRAQREGAGGGRTRHPRSGHNGGAAGPRRPLLSLSVLGVSVRDGKPGQILDDHVFEENQWFLRRGVPLLVSERVAKEPAQVWRRALPALLALYAVILLRGLVMTDQSVVADAGVGGAVLLLTWIVSNLLQRQRLFSLPNGLGPFELTAFVVGPAIPSLLTTEAAALLLEGDSLGVRIIGALMVMAFQLCVLATVWVAVSFGVVSLIVWLLRELGQTLGTTGAALSRTVPLLLGVVTFFFLTAEVWQSIGLLRWFPYSLLILLFTVLGGVFIARGRNLDIGALATFETRSDLEAVVLQSGLPVWTGEQHRFDNMEFPAVCPLGRRQRANLVVVAVLSRLILATVVAVVVGMFFVVFGFLVVNGDVVQAWTLRPAREIFSLRVPTRTLTLTWEHINVAGFLATFSGFYFTIVSATDPTLRAGLRDTAEDGVRSACAARIMLHT